MSNLILVAACDEAVQAKTLRGLLEAQNITVHMFQGARRRVAWGIPESDVYQIDLHVPENQAAEARAIVQEYFALGKLTPLAK